MRTAVGSLLKLSLRDCCGFTQTCSFASAVASSTQSSGSSSHGSSNSSSGPPSTSGREKDLVHLWPTGPCVPRSLMDMTFDQLMEHYEQHRRRMFAYSEPKLLLLARKVSNSDQLQLLLEALRSNYLHHRKSAPGITYSTHLSSALLEAVVASGADASAAVALLEQAPELGLSVSQRMCHRVLHHVRKSGSTAQLQRAWVLAQAHGPVNSLLLRERAIAVGSILQKAAAGDPEAAAYSSERQRERLAREMQQIKQQLESKGNPMPLAVWEALMQAGVVTELPAAVASRKTPQRPAAATPAAQAAAAAAAPSSEAAPQGSPAAATAAGAGTTEAAGSAAAAASDTKPTGA